LIPLNRNLSSHTPDVTNRSSFEILGLRKHKVISDVQNNRLIFKNVEAYMGKIKGVTLIP
jgi:hypothetical protein